VAVRDGVVAVAWREGARGAPASAGGALRVRMARWR
jgi:hypothetical protein